MTEPSAFDPNDIKSQPLGPPVGLLEHLNLPPKTIRFIRRNQQKLWLTFSAVVVVAVAIASYSTYRSHHHLQAASALDEALAAGKDKKAKLEEVADEFGSAPSGIWAEVELARIEEEAKEIDQALVRLEAINDELSSKSPLKQLVVAKLAGLYEGQQQWDKALAQLEPLAEVTSYAPEAYRAMGRIYEQQKKTPQAIQAYEKYLELSAGQNSGQGQDPLRQMIQFRVSQLKK